MVVTSPPKHSSPSWAPPTSHLLGGKWGGCHEGGEGMEGCEWSQGVGEAPQGTPPHHPPPIIELAPPSAWLPKEGGWVWALPPITPWWPWVLGGQGSLPRLGEVVGPHQAHECPKCHGWGKGSPCHQEVNGSHGGTQWCQWPPWGEGHPMASPRIQYNHHTRDPPPKGPNCIKGTTRAGVYEGLRPCSKGPIRVGSGGILARGHGTDRCTFL